MARNKPFLLVLVEMIVMNVIVEFILYLLNSCCDCIKKRKINAEDEEREREEEKRERKEKEKKEKEKGEKEENVRKEREKEEIDVQACKSFGPYLKEKWLGEGGQGNVYTGRHFQTKAVYAIKVMTIKDNIEFGKKSIEERAVDAEVQVGTSLGRMCKYLVNYEEVIFRGKECYIVMEFCTGGNLRKSIEKQREKMNPYSKEEVIRFMQQIGSAIRTLHESNVMHRDIKPENIFLTDRQTYKLGDYGTSRIVSYGRTMTAAGTQAYSAPEVFNGDNHYEKSVDIFSFGCVLFEMMALRHPFNNDIGNLNFMKLMNADYYPMKAEVIDRYGAELTGLVKRMMSMDPSARPSIADILSAVSK